MEPITADYYCDKAFQLEEEGRKSEAVHLYSMAIDLDYNFKRAIEARARLYLELENYNGALVDYNHLAYIETPEDYLRELGICNEKLGNYPEALKYYIESLIKNVDTFAYQRLYQLVHDKPELESFIDFKAIKVLLDKYSDEARAQEFKEKASECDLDQRNYFLDLSISLMPKTSPLLYQAYLDKADAEIFRFRFCHDKAFKDELMKKAYDSNTESVNVYVCNQDAVTEMNLVFAVQRLNEAVRYAVNLDEVNELDSKIFEIRSLTSYASGN